MLYFSRWKAAAILLTAFVVCLFAVPNFLPEKTVQSWPNWAQRHIVLASTCRAARTSCSRSTPTRCARRSSRRCATTCAACCARRASAIPASWCAATASKCASARAAISSRRVDKLRELSQPLGGILGSSTGQRTLDVTTEAGSLIRLTLTEPAIVERIRQAVEQSIQIVERRVNELGTVEPTIQRQGADRILVQVPGLQDP